MDASKGDMEPKCTEVVDVANECNSNYDGLVKDLNNTSSLECSQTPIFIHVPSQSALMECLQELTHGQDHDFVFHNSSASALENGVHKSNVVEIIHENIQSQSEECESVTVTNSLESNIVCQVDCQEELQLRNGETVAAVKDPQETTIEAQTEPLKELVEIEILDSTINNAQREAVESSYRQPVNVGNITSNVILGIEDPDICKRRKVELFTTVEGPQIHVVKSSIVTPPIISENLPKAFEGLPISGYKLGDNLIEFQDRKLREFVGADLDDDGYKEITEYCSVDHLKTGNELAMKSSVPKLGLITVSSVTNYKLPEIDYKTNKLRTLAKLRLRNEGDPSGNYQGKLKYRGQRLLPLSQQQGNYGDEDLEELVPGQDQLFIIRIYRPFPSFTWNRAKLNRTRHSVFSCNMVATGRHLLSALRDRIVCPNDADMRTDVSHDPDSQGTTTSKEVFPSGFLFINNVFYVDTRCGTTDNSEPLREWARRKNIGEFPRMDMCTTRLGDIRVRLGYPEVYIHQGDCEHVFTFSEMRLVSPSDPLRVSQYPCHTACSANQTIYCNTCVDYSAKWLVDGCNMIPYDPGFFCDSCFRSYLYKDGRKICDFKAFAYKANSLNFLKPYG